MEPLPKRKTLRARPYDYSQSGAYFITVCVKGRRPLLSSITKPTVGDGAFDVPQLKLTPIGKIVEKYLLSSERISGVKIDTFVIMPDHLHAIIFLDNKMNQTNENGTSRAPPPTNERLPHIISTFKRFCHREIGEDIFQRGYMDHIIRDREDYETRRKYIYENPLRWIYKDT